MTAERDVSDAPSQESGETVEPGATLADQTPFDVTYVDPAESSLKSDASDTDCVVVLARRVEGQWVDIVEQASATDPNRPVVLVTTESTEQLARAAIESDIDGYVDLGDETADQLVETVESAVEDAQSETEQRYRLLAERAGDPMCVLDADGRLLLCNEALTDLLGKREAEIVGEPISEFVPEDGIEAAEQLLTELRDDDDRRYGVVASHIETADDEQVPCEVSVAPATEEEGENPQSVVVIRDVTERRQQQRELEQQNERLEEFVSVISHDLRNPLAVAMSRLELLTVDGENEHHAEIDTALTRMEEIIDDLLSIARSGTGADEIQPVSIRDTARDAWEIIETGDATLTVDTEADIEADPGRLQQLFENLFRNAMEHIDDAPKVRIGPIEPIQTATRSTEDVDPTGFYVSDNGPGIPREKRDSVFEYGETGADGGTGFGLAIVQDIVSEHDWQIHVTGNATGGARFEVEGVSFVGD